MCIRPPSVRGRSSTFPTSVRWSSAAGSQPRLLAAQLREVDVQHPVIRIEALAQRVEELEPRAKGVRRLLLRERARLVEQRRAAALRAELVELDHEVLPALIS